MVIQNRGYSMQKVIFYLLLVVSFSLVSCQNSSNKDVLTDAVNAQPGTQEDLDTNVGNFVLFELNDAKLNDEAISTLNNQAEWLKTYRYINVMIAGHCDERGTREFNLALGARRANVVKDYLVSAGIDASRISTVSYGKERPVVLGSSSEVWKQNRRAVVIIN